jgi:protein gp37
MVSPGCTNCYAMRLAARLELMGLPKYAGTTRRSGGRAVWTGKITIDEQALEAPLKWRRPRRIFVNSMSDLFHEDVPAGIVQRVWLTMRATPWHTYQILTKRPGRMATVLAEPHMEVLPNVWLGTSVEDNDQSTRLDVLRTVPAAIRFVSFEPLLGSIGSPDLGGIHWAIVGGESGPHARPMRRTWVDEIRRACRRQKVAFFFKQWGGLNKKSTGRQLGKRTYDEFPAASASHDRMASMSIRRD